MNALQRLTSLSAIALSIATPCSIAQAGDTHTFHHVTVSSGDWHGQLVITSPGEDAYFTNASGENYGSMWAFDPVTPQAPFTFGFGFIEPGTDFNASYTLTMVKKVFTGPQFVSKACQFNISAKGPANPDIRTETYNGADCHYTITDKGEDYSVG